MMLNDGVKAAGKGAFRVTGRVFHLLLCRMNSRVSRRGFIGFPYLFMGMIWVMWIMGMILPPGPVHCREYALYGDLELSTAAVSGYGLPDRLTAQALLRLEHLLLYDWGEVDIRHSFRVAALHPAAAQAAAAGSENDDLERLTAWGPDILAHQIQQLSVTFWPSDSVTLRLGRHSVPWGMGYAFYPGDALHPPRMPDSDTPGFDGGSFTWTLSPDWTATAALRLDTALNTDLNNDPGRWPENLRWAALASGYAGSLEVAAGLVWQPDTLLRPGAGFSIQAGETIIHGEAAFELIGKEGSLGTGEGANGAENGADEANENGTAETFGSSEELLGSLFGRPAEKGLFFTAGGQRIFYAGDHSLTLICEYGYTDFYSLPESGGGDEINGVGESGGGDDGEGAALLAWGPHFLFIQAAYEYGGRGGVESAVLWAPEDKAVVVTGRGNIAPADTLEFGVEALFLLTGIRNWKPDFKLARLYGKVYF